MNCILVDDEESARARLRRMLAAHPDIEIAAEARDPQGLGLVNIAGRLRTLYREDASVTLEPLEGGGSRATALIPRARALNVL